MINHKRIISLSLAFLMLAVVIISAVSSAALAAEDSFEKQLKQFPESYHPYLRELHKEYPKWNFEVFKTGLDWKTVIDNEHTDYALVYNPDAATIFKSREADDYDAENDRYYYKDGSFVAGSRIAVEYFMDPRNFLDVGGIFQFELLSFNSLYSVEMVEAVLEGSFMSNAKMTWLDKNGKKKSSKTTYAEAIYNAGKANNINPCFLASKILNEVGSEGSASVTGNHDTYPGLYNFYNIGATDGEGAIGRGLLWASGGSNGLTTYSRPWTTPEKSIKGGAEFLAEEYIAAGQFTGYLQRFNVNPKSDYELYTHQYMSNLTGALSQGYTTYRSYKEMGILDESITFSIPVFENMSNADGSAKLEGAESTEQYGTINRDYRYVRQGPSVDYDVVTDASGASLIAKKGTEVQILQKTDTDAYYYEEILTYPYWYKVSFASGDKIYTGYIPASRVNVVTAVHVAKGKADIALARSENMKNQLVTSDPSAVKIIDDNTVKFLKNGFVTVYAYDSWGFFEEIRFKVGNYSSYYPSSPKASVSGSTVKVSSGKHSSATGYGYALSDKHGNLTKAEFTAKNSRTFKNLASGAAYDIYVQNRFDKYIFTKAVQLPVVVKPSEIKGFDFTKDYQLNCTLTWNKLSEVSGYQVASYDEGTKKYTAVKTLANVDSCTLSAEQVKKADKYAVRAFSKYDGVTVYGAYSEIISLSSKAPTPSALTFADETTASFTLKWTGNELCNGYEVYMAKDSGAEPTLYKTVTASSLKLDGFTQPSYRKFKVRSYTDTPQGRIYSDFTPVASVITRPAKPQSLKLSVTSSSLTASWKAVDGAKYYYLTYRKGTGESKTVKSEGTSYTLNSLPGYTEYSVYVTAVAAEGNVSASGAASKTVTKRTKPEVPKNFRVEFKGYNHIDLAWDDNGGIDLYKIYYYNASSKLIGEVTTTENSIRIKGLAPQSVFKFKIRGYKTVDGKNIGSDASSTLKSKTVIPKVTGFKVSSVKAKSFVLSWDKLEGATHYNVYYKKDGKYQRIMKPKKNSCTVTVLPVDSKGNFYVTASFGKGDNAVESKRSTIFSATVKPSKVTGLKVTPGTDSVELSWNKVKNATGYAVYIYKDGKYEKKKMLKGTSYTLKKLESAASVTVSVRAYTETSLGNFYGSHAEKSFYTKPVDVKKITQSNKTDTSYTLKWSKSSDNVNRYYVYRYNESKKKYEKLASTKKTSYTVKGLTPGTTQRYTVLAAVVKDGKAVTKSKRAFELTCSTALPTTENLRLAEATTSSVKLAWNKVKGADGYRVYYYSASAEGFKLYKEVKGTSITIDGIASGKKNMFRVRAVKRTDYGTFYGLYSSNLVASTK